MKRIITACVLLFLIVLGCIMECHTVLQTTSTLSASIAGQTAPEVLSASYAEWQKKRNLLSAMIAHDEIDQIETLYLRAMQAAKNHDLDETRLQVAELSGMLTHLSELQFPHLYNIF